MNGKNKPTKPYNQGFTLVELLVALLITGVLLGTASTTFLMSQKIYTRGANISDKKGTITNVETNLQNYLSIATAVTLASAPKTDDQKSYSIGFKNDGTCEEVIMIENLDASGNPVLVGGKHCTESRSTISQISEIQVGAVGTNVATLNYDLIPFDSMSTLSGGIVMNNIKLSNANMPSTELEAGTNLNASTNGVHYLVLTFEGFASGGTTPGIDDKLKDAGVIPGNWDNMIAYAKIAEPWGYRFDDEGSVYTDKTGTFVTSKAQYITRDFAKGDPTALNYYDSLGGEGNDYFLKITETTRVITADDYETDTTKWGCIWKADRYPKLGDLYLYNGAYYIWENKGSSVYSVKNPTSGNGWLKLVSAPAKFQ